MLAQVAVFFIMFLVCIVQKSDALRNALEEMDDIAVRELLEAKADPYRANEVSC